MSGDAQEKDGQHSGQAPAPQETDRPCRLRTFRLIRCVLNRPLMSCVCSRCFSTYVPDEINVPIAG